MRHVLLRSWAAFALLVAAAPAFASAPALVALGSGRDVSLEDLQQKVDAVVGAGHVNVRTDFIGAHAGDPSPWFWINDGVHAIAVTLIDRDSPRGAIGWYEETGHVPVLDGIGDGVVLTDLRVRNTRTLVRMPTAVKHFGFYILQKGDGEEHENGQTSIVYTNNLFNDPGPHDLVSDHPSPAGERQAFIFDVSRWLGTDTWLVASPSPSEDGHSGHGSNRHSGHEDGDDDDDDDDDAALLFTVTGLAVTPVHSVTFSQVKALFR